MVSIWKVAVDGGRLEQSCFHPTNKKRPGSGVPFLDLALDLVAGTMIATMAIPPLICAGFAEM